MSNEDVYNEIKTNVSDMIEKVKNMNENNCDDIIQEIKSKLKNADTCVDTLK